LTLHQPRTTRRLGSIACVAACLACGVRAHAHGFGERYDLPVPLWLWIGAAAAAVILSFVLMGGFVTWRLSGTAYPRFILLRFRIARALTSALFRRVVQSFSAVLLVLVVAAGLFGDQTPTRNLAPTFIWIVWWVGFAYLSALVGNVWTFVNPWEALFITYETLSKRALHTSPEIRRRRWPLWLGVWPAAMLFFVFAWVELVYDGRSIPSHLAWLCIGYSALTWAGMFVFGRTVWLRNADPFANAFGAFARFSVTEARPREWNLRPFGVGLLDPRDVTPSMVVFVLLLLSTVTFDGFSATPLWGRLQDALYSALPGSGNARLTFIGSAGLAVFAGGFVAIYALIARAIAVAGRREIESGAVARLFVLSLVPIAIAYHLAHYFTYLLIQGQLVIRLASDPFGFGWDLFGTARHPSDIGIVGARFAWYVAVVAIVIGHVVAVSVAHIIALREYSNRRVALRSQVPMLILMVVYTMVGLWIIAQPIVETR